MRRRELAGLALGAIASPLVARGQQPARVYRLAIAHPTRPVESMHSATAPPRFLGALFRALEQRGYTEGQNLTVEAYSGEGLTALYRALAERVVATKPDAIFTMGDLDGPFKAATATIPIVAAAGNDALTTDLVSNFAHPGGNLTGVSVSPGPDIWGKRLSLLIEALPAARRVVFLSTRAAWESPDVNRAAIATRSAAEKLGLSLVPALMDSASEPEYRKVFATLPAANPDALLLGDGAEHYGFAALLGELTSAGRIPSIFPDRSFADAGGMMSYGVDFPDLFSHAGDDVARIFAGAAAGDIPFYQPTRYELVVNLKTAKALGVPIPAMLQAGADDLIE